MYLTEEVNFTEKTMYEVEFYVIESMEEIFNQHVYLH